MWLSQYGTFHPAVQEKEWSYSSQIPETLQDIMAGFSVYKPIQYTKKPLISTLISRLFPHGTRG